MFSAVSYASRNKYLSTNDKIYSTVVQETQAEMALSEVTESIFQYNLQPEHARERGWGFYPGQDHFTNR